MKDAISYLNNRIAEGSMVKAQHPEADITAGVEQILDIYERIPTEEELRVILEDIAYSVIQPKVKSTGGSTDKPGMCLLTSTASAIGKGILRDNKVNLEGDDLDIWKFHLNIGVLVCEALRNTGYVNIEFDRGMKAYTITTTDKWQFIRVYARRIRGTVPEPIEPIKGLHQKSGRPVIKQWKPQDNETFQEFLDEPFVKALDKVQQQSWKINKRVYATLLKYRKDFTTVIDNGDELRLQQDISKASEFRSIVAIVSKIRRWPEFYQYAECDYRGRIYFSQPFLNFQGSDTARGLYLFGEAKPVTEKGLRWLAIHTACSYNQSYHIDEIPEWTTSDYRSHLEREGLDSLSVDKMTLDDRSRWTYMHMDLIRSTAREDHLPDCEKPVAFLAACYEWERYHEDPSAFVSALPIPVDGSNNGWQHLAAISQDAQAGSLVGLVPAEIQEDFYVRTAQALIARIPEWFEERGMPMKHIRKGISKRGSMTRAYSAGARKIADNMYLDCRTEGFDKKYNITEQDCLMLARYLVEAINNVCPGPLRTMYFLQECAEHKIRSNPGINYLTWETPAGFPVVYEAPRKDTQQHKISIRNANGGSKRVSLRGEFPTEFADVHKFMCGISPNFIHSLDAAHMCNVIDQWHGSFGGVHDSFSTHADDVDDLVAVTKDVFIKQYEVDEGTNFSKIRSMLDLEDSPITDPGVGSLELEEVRSSDYFFA